VSVRPCLRRRAAWTLPGLVVALVAGPVVTTGLLGSASAAVAESCAAAVPFYGVGADGSLAEWIAGAPTTPGAVTLASASAGTGWSPAARVLSGGAGVLYTETPDGRLQWYRHTGGATGANTWDPASGAAVGQGWNEFRTVVSAGGGVLYGVMPDGTLHWYRHTGYANGAATWAAGSGGQVGVGWGMFTRLVPGGYGALYGVAADGRLRWYAHDGWQSGRAVWAAGSGTVVGVGWGMFSALLSGGGGLVFGVLPDGTVRWYNHLGDATGTAVWAAGSGSVLAGLNLTGYAHPVADPTVCTGLDRTDTTAVRRVASGVLAASGWSATEFSCLSSIAARESSWRWDAGSPAGAYGIPQAQPGAQMFSAGPDWLVDPITQVRWMLAYVVGRYASPCKAWAFWQVHLFY
jgi:Tachylectin